MRILALLFAVCSCVLAESNPLTEVVTARYNSVKKNLMHAAEAMPAEDYSLKLSAEQRPFSLWVEHTAVGNLNLCSAIKLAPPPDVSKIRGLTGKADLVKALKESFDFCDAALSGMTDQKALTESNGRYPATAMVLIMGSLYEHNGNISPYLRTKGIASQAAPPPKK